LKKKTSSQISGKNMNSSATHLVYNN